eukprot:COSAG01_NODE_2610_length_7384_cov_12.240906_8_plen_161_part_00
MPPPCSNGAYVSFIFYLWGSAKSEPALVFYYSMGIVQNLLIYFLKRHCEATSTPALPPRVCLLSLCLNVRVDERLGRAHVFPGLPRTAELETLQQNPTQQELLLLAVEQGDYGRAAALATALERRQRQQQQHGTVAGWLAGRSEASEVASERLAGRSGVS